MKLVRLAIALALLLSIAVAQTGSKTLDDRMSFVPGQMFYYFGYSPERGAYEISENVLGKNEKGVGHRITLINNRTGEIKVWHNTKTGMMWQGSETIDRDGQRERVYRMSIRLKDGTPFEFDRKNYTLLIEPVTKMPDEIPAPFTIEEMNYHPDPRDFIGQRTMASSAQEKFLPVFDGRRPDEKLVLEATLDDFAKKRVSVNVDIQIGTKDMGGWQELSEDLALNGTLHIWSRPDGYYRVAVVGKGLSSLSFVWPKKTIRIEKVDGSRRQTFNGSRWVTSKK